MLSFISAIHDEQSRTKLELIYINYKNDAYWTSYNILRDYHEAEDVVQDAIIKISLMIDKIDDIKCNKTKSLVIIIVRNLSFNIYNKRKRTNFFLYDDQLEAISTELELDEHLIRLEKAKWISEKLGEINPTYADILTLKFYYEYTNEEISKLIGINEGNVRVRIHRAKLVIKHLIERGVDYVEDY